MSAAVGVPEFEVERFDVPQPGMPDHVRDQVSAGRAVAFRGSTTDGRVAWFPVSVELLDEIRGLEDEVRTHLGAALHDLEGN
jgi:hypothetical protein